MRTAVFTVLLATLVSSSAQAGRLAVEGPLREISSEEWSRTQERVVAPLLERVANGEWALRATRLEAPLGRGLALAAALHQGLLSIGIASETSCEPARWSLAQRAPEGSELSVRLPAGLTASQHDAATATISRLLAR
ncbi:MAG: hypothetical protein IT371_20195 [Deltaproteobacteria bacterium]|nr:hypothetical protein [Deltaproteobacteria bacterium]